MFREKIRYLGNVLKFIVKKRYLSLFTAAIFLLVTSWWIFNFAAVGPLNNVRVGLKHFGSSLSSAPDVHFWTWLEPITGIVTLAVAVLVWLGEAVQDEDNAVPKRLSVYFRYNDREIMRCEKAYLAGENDIRAWGQQLGRQMIDGKQLFFDPLPDQPPAQRDVDDKTGKSIKLYTVTFFLTKQPEKIGKISGQELIDQINKGKTYVLKYNKEQKRFIDKWL